MSSHSHIIHRLIVEVEAPNETIAHRVKDNISSILHYDVLPALEKYLDSLDIGSEPIRMENLKIDIGALPYDQLETELENRVMSSFRQIAGQIPSMANEQGDSFRLRYPARFYPDKDNSVTKELMVKKVSVSGQIIEALLFFLESGTLPWDITTGNEILEEENILEIFLENKTWISEDLAPLLAGNEIAVLRFTIQFSASFLERVLSLIMEEAIWNEIKTTGGQIETIPEEEHFTTENVCLVFWRIVTRLFFTKPGMEKQELLTAILDNVISYYRDLPVSDLIIQRLSELPEIRQTAQGKEIVPILSPEKKIQSPGFSWPVTGPEQRAEQPAVQRKIQEAFGKQAKEIFVQNAGMILLHPFLKHFFMDFDLLAEDRFTNSKKHQTAVHLLHYLVTTEIYAPEYKLILEKYLCGYPIDEPVERFVEISDEMKTECENLLNAVIRNWKQLKNTSPDGLREGFLHREGKLLTESFQHRLIVENKAQDVLLSYLPWGYSIIKLPWMQQPLHVDWSY
jgi:hypothetical protein